MKTLARAVAYKHLLFRSEQNAKYKKTKCKAQILLSRLAHFRDN